jgi:hypothetical protein
MAVQQAINKPFAGLPVFALITFDIEQRICIAAEPLLFSLAGASVTFTALPTAEVVKGIIIVFVGERFTAFISMLICNDG